MELADRDGEESSDPDELASDALAEPEGADNGLNPIIDTLENGNAGLLKWRDFRVDSSVISSVPGTTKSRMGAEAMRGASRRPVAVVLFFAALHLVGNVAKADFLYTEEFESGDGGWWILGGVHQPSGGVGDSGFLQGTRPSAGSGLYFSPSSPPASTYSQGDLEDLYGSWIRVSYYAKVLESPAVPSPPLHQFFGVTTNQPTVWQKTVAADLAPFVADWTEISFDVDVNWTNQEAEAHGWERRTGLNYGTASWSDTLHSVVSTRIFEGIGSSEAGVSIGLDDYRMGSIPEPSALVMLSGVGLVAAGANPQPPRGSRSASVWYFAASANFRKSASVTS